MPFFLYYLRGTSKMSGLQSSSFCPQNSLFMLGRNKTKQQITALIPSSFPTSLHSPPKVSQSDPFIHTLFFPFSLFLLPIMSASPSSSSSSTLKIGIVGFGSFGQFLAKTMIKQGHTLRATSRTDYSHLCLQMGIRFFR